MNEESKKLKDFQIMISTKTDPKSTIILKRTVIILFFLLIALTCKFFKFFSKILFIKIYNLFFYEIMVFSNIILFIKQLS